MAWCASVSLCGARPSGAVASDSTLSDIPPGMVSPADLTWTAINIGSPNSQGVSGRVAWVETVIGNTGAGTIWGQYATPSGSVTGLRWRHSQTTLWNPNAGSAYYYTALARGGCGWWDVAHGSAVLFTRRANVEMIDWYSDLIPSTGAFSRVASTPWPIEFAGGGPSAGTFSGAGPLSRGLQVVSGRLIASWWKGDTLWLTRDFADAVSGPLNVSTPTRLLHAIDPANDWDPIARHMWFADSMDAIEVLT